MTDFRAVNHRGVTLYSFGDLASARKWARENVHRHVGITVEAIEVTRRTVYRPRRPMADSFAIPAMPGVA